MWLDLRLLYLLLIFTNSVPGLLLEEEDAASSINSCKDTNSNEQELSGSRQWRVFNQLTQDETEQVLSFLIDELGYYNLTGGGPTPTTSGPNLIYRVELMEPNKEQVLNYLDGEGPEPERFAFAVLIRSTNQPKDVMEYKIGPLPINPGARKSDSEIGENGDDSPREGVVMEKLKRDGEIPFSKRPSESVSTRWSNAVINREAYKLRRIFKETTGWCYGVNFTTTESTESSSKECGTGLIDWLAFPALDQNTSKRIFQVVWFFRTRRGGGDEMLIHSIPISFKLDEADTDEQNWNTFDFEYCHQGPFSSAEDLLEAYEKGEVRKCEAEDWKDYNYDEGWSRTNNRNRFRSGSERPAPRTFYPDGPRFSIDQAEQGTGYWFNYLGWEGHISMRYGTGITLHDLRFRRNRIVYELSLQEQFVSYSGFAGGGQTVYMDSYYGIGLASQPLRKGRDCPENARYLPMLKNYLNGIIQMGDDAYCIFEEDAQMPEWRHTHFNGSTGRPHTDSIRRSTLVIRTVATVGNYDYIYSIRFRPDASISVETTLAGYMLASFFDVTGQTVRDTVFGTRVQKHALALLHDHLSGWKVDLDVLGVDNSIRRTSIKVGTWEEAMKDVINDTPRPPPWHRGQVVKYIQSETLENEFGFLIRDPGTVVHAFVNEQYTNKWGYPRGYAIMHGMTARQLLPNTHPFTKACAWSKYHLAVTQRKENELLSHSAIYDMVAPGDPIVSLDHYLNDESITQTDLVAWVMMGLMHVPRSEDVPLISNVGSQFFIKPWNYYDELVSMDVGNNEQFESCQPSVGNDYNYRWAFDPTD
eukprot:g461.t1